MMDSTMTHGHSLTVRTTIRATPERVFAAWTDPERLRAWYAADASWQTPVAEVDLRVGGAYRIGMQPPGRPEPFFETGEYVEIDPPHRLVYTQDTAGPSDAAGQHVLVTVVFTPTAEGTEVVVTEHGYDDPSVRDRHQSGWPRFLDRLAALLSA